MQGAGQLAQGVGREGAVTKPGILEDIVWENCIVLQMDRVPPLSGQFQGMRA